MNHIDKPIAVVGAGFSGAVIARELAEAGRQCEVFDSRSYIAGNCYTERDTQTNIMVHRHGPHIFHTNNETVWNYIRRFGEFAPYIHRVKAVVQDRVFSLPINLHTINQFFNTHLSPADAELFLRAKRDLSIAKPNNFEQQARHTMGSELYEAFFKGYTIKQWGQQPKQIPAYILKRLPLRFSYDDNYFNHRFQAIPTHGYTSIIANILDHPRINISLNEKFARTDRGQYAHVFYSGSLDEYFNYCEGMLPYRTLEFEELKTSGDYQGTSVINYCDSSVPYTRITEHKHFAPWESHNQSICFKEYSRDAQIGDTLYYPVNLRSENQQLNRYQDIARTEKGVSFVGRLGTFRYLDMDLCIAEALATSSEFLDNN